jgi:hypothetical protein
MSSPQEKTMTPLETLPAMLPGHITLVFPTVILTVPMSFISDVKSAAMGENLGLKNLAEEIIQETKKDDDADPNLITHLVHAFMAMKMKMNPPPIQLDLWPDEEFLQDLPPDLNNAMTVIREKAEEFNKLAIDNLIEAPARYKEERKRRRTIGTMNPFRTFTWVALVAGLGLYLGFNWEAAHWGLVATEGLLLFFYKPILFDHPQGEKQDGS